jgi:A/G-specific adenine glycosylase
MERYPTVQDLAATSEDEVLLLWQGLGYYSRARNLRTAAQQVVAEHGGRFPADHAALLGLKGVGDYTASAIASICFNIPEPVVDGNVYRLLARVFGIATPIDSTAGKKEFRARAAELIPTDHPGDHNQAMMELGATVCTPRDPDCDACPLVRKCAAHAQGKMTEYPVKAGRTTVRTRHFNYLILRSEEWMVLRKRGPKDIWQGLWEPPLIETSRPIGERTLLKELGKLLSGRTEVIGRSPRIKHMLSHQHIQAVFWHIHADLDDRVPDHWIRVDRAALDSHALPRLIERYLAEEGTAKRP